MDARRILDQLYEDPPSPVPLVNNLVVAWSSLIRLMKISGLYFDGCHYPRVVRLHSERLGSDKISTQKVLRGDINGFTVEVSSTPKSISIPTSSSPESASCAIPIEDFRCNQDNDHMTSFEVDNFVPTLLRHPTGVIDEQVLVNLLCNEGASLDCGDITWDASEDAKTHRKVVTPIWRSIRNCVLGGCFYTVVVTCLLWAGTFRSITSFFDSRVDWAVSVGTLLFFLKTAMNSSMLLVSCWKKSHFSVFFVNWYLLFADLTSRRLGLYNFSISTNMKLVMAVMMSFLAVNIGISSVVVFVGAELGDFTITLYFNLGNKVLSAVATFMCHVYGTFGWISPVVFMIVTFRHITAAFVHFRTVLKLHINAAGGRFPAHFRELRERHLVMCNLTTMMDKYIKIALTVIYSFNTAMACVLVYQVIAFKREKSLLFYIFWLLTSLFSMSVLTLYASNVNLAMVSVKEDLQALQTRSITVDEQTQLQLFLAKLNDPHLGFTVLGVIAVKRELIFTLYGLYLTYAFVLLQFK